MSEKQIKLSANSLNLSLECPHCFWLEKNKGIKRPPPYPYALNSAVDDLLKQEFDTYRSKKLPHPIFKENHIKAHLFPNQKLLNQWRNNLAGIRYFDENLKATLFGAMDDVLEFDPSTSSGQAMLAPMDYKSTGSPTAKIYDRFQLQLDVYAFLLEKNGFKVKRKGYLVFYVVDKTRGFIDRLPFRKEILEVETSPADVYDIFKDAVDILRKEMPPEHSEDCLFGKYLGSVLKYNI